jgi:hypothetical protein
MIPQERELNGDFKGFLDSLSLKPPSLSICHLVIYAFDLLNNESLNSCKKLGEKANPLIYDNIDLV